MDDYSDLPDWIRPGAKIAALGSRDAEKITVVRLTKTLIVTRHDIYGHEVKYRRTPSSKGEYIRMGDFFGPGLVRRDDPRARLQFARQRAGNFTTSVEEIIKAYNRPEKDDKRPAEERALEMFDRIENQARTARARVLKLIDPDHH